MTIFFPSSHVVEISSENDDSNQCRQPFNLILKPNVHKELPTGVQPGEDRKSEKPMTAIASVRVPEHCPSTNKGPISVWEANGHLLATCLSGHTSELTLKRDPKHVKTVAKPSCTSPIMEHT